MKCEVLISTMNIQDNEELIKKMNITGKSLTINQITDKNLKLFNSLKEENRIISIKEKGLSKSRNLAIKNSKFDICIIADDDLVYKENYEKKIMDAYNKYIDADIIAFNVDNCKVRNKYKHNKIGFLSSFKVCSVQLTFKTKSIVCNKIKFDELFGAGSGMFVLGEENIFLTDCLKKGLKIYFVNETIATLTNRESTWFSGFDKDYFYSKGACFYRINKFFSPLFIIQFALRKYKIYRGDMNFCESIKNMFIGIKKYKKIK